ncbi:MAG: DegT/DnrJ/EryC1/StrS family aminotransferase [Bacteroidetes bacterium]|nr:DegT/DnrJ/EryC1/StrS family aminotransferase [Bacteroidota bacterium]
MRPLSMVDLKSQHLKIKNELDAAMAEVMETTAFIKGPQVAKFEADLATYLGCKYVTGCANGTDALQIALMALNLPKGSEIITPDFTFVATAEVVRLLGFTPVIVDVDADTFNILPSSIEEAITENTKAIIPVHLFGQCADMDAIMAIAKKHNLFVIEDTAQAIGADCFYQGKKVKAGTVGHIGCTSFFPSKNLGCAGDGGAMFTNDEELHKQIHSIANHGMGKHYHYDYIGVNSRLDTLQAAVLGVKLPHLDEYNAARRNAADKYDTAFAGIASLQTPKRATNSTHIFHQYTLKVLDGRRDGLGDYLNNNKIPNKVYYPVAVHESRAYKTACRFEESRLLNTINLCKEVISLPMHTELDDEQIEFITTTVKQYFN